MSWDALSLAGAHTSDAAAGISGLHSLTLHENAWPPLTLRPVVFRGAASDLVAQGRWPSWDDFEPRNWVQWFDNPAVAAKGLPGQRFHYLDTEQRAIVRPAAVPLRLGDARCPTQRARIAAAALRGTGGAPLLAQRGRRVSSMSSLSRARCSSARCRC